MEALERTRTITSSNYLDIATKYLEYLNVIVPKEKKLTKMEVKVLALLMELWAPQDVMFYLFAAPTRKEIRKKLNFKEASNFDNYVSFLKKKGYIVKDKQGVLRLAPILRLPIDGTTIKLNINLQYEQG